jgi:hypothetical protein
MDGYEMPVVDRVRHTLWIIIADLLALFVYGLILGALTWL